MSGSPNILLVVADQHRHDWIEDDGTLPVRTPHLRALAERGVRFERATTPAPLCAPARACLATGLDYDHGPVPNNVHDLPLDARTYYRELRDRAGYHVTGVGKFDLHKATFDWNLDGSRCLSDWGFSAGVDNEGKFDSLWSGRIEPRGPYMAHLYEQGLAATHIADFERRKGAAYSDTSPSPLPEESYLDNWIAANAHRQLDASPTDRPWHLSVNFAGPHDPMDVPPALVERWRDVDFAPYLGAAAGDAVRVEAMRRYAAMIENIDTHVGRLLDHVAARGELEDTLVIYTSDHGEMLGDHGTWGKQVGLDASIRIPLILAGAMVERHGEASTALVTLEDVAATALDAAGLEVPSQMTSRSLIPLLSGRVDRHRSHLISGLDRATREIENARRHYGDNPWHGLQRWRTVTSATHKLVLSPDLPAPRLFDLTHDPAEEHDIAAANPHTVHDLIAQLPPQVASAMRPA